MIDRGGGQPSVNLVVLSFVHPYRLLKQTTDAQTLNGVPRAMTADVVNYFKSHGIRVMLSIGGITYVSAWNQALAENPTQLGLNAAAVAQSLGVGIEIDYEESRTPNNAGLQAFIDAYRWPLPYDASGTNHAARLTIDLAAGDRWLIGLTTKATTDWQEHVDGKAQYAPPIPPLAPAKFTGSVYIAEGTKPYPECVNYSKALQSVGDAELRDRRGFQRLRRYSGHARLHVLGGGATVHARYRDGAAKYVREWCRRGGGCLGRADPDARLAPAMMTAVSVSKSFGSVGPTCALADHQLITGERRTSKEK